MALHSPPNGFKILSLAYNAFYAMDPTSLSINSFYLPPLCLCVHAYLAVRSSLTNPHTPLCYSFHQAAMAQFSVFISQLKDPLFSETFPDCSRQSSLASSSWFSSPLSVLSYRTSCIAYLLWFLYLCPYDHKVLKVKGGGWIILN